MTEKTKEGQVPKLQIDESGNFQEETTKIPLMVNGKEEIVVLRKITAGERGQIRSECTNVKIIGTQPRIDVNDAELEARILHAGIKSAPFPTDLITVKKLPTVVFDYLMAELNEFAGTTDKKKEVSEKPLED